MSTEHIILVAFDVYADSREDAHGILARNLRTVRDSGEVDSWWVAEDDRADGSDNDSAVFVSPGAQGVASRLLHAHGLTPACNLVPGDANRWEFAEASS